MNRTQISEMYSLSFSIIMCTPKTQPTWLDPPSPFLVYGTFFVVLTASLVSFFILGVLWIFSLKVWSSPCDMVEEDDEENDDDEVLLSSDNMESSSQQSYVSNALWFSGSSILTMIFFIAFLSPLLTFVPYGQCRHLRQRM